MSEPAYRDAQLGGLLKELRGTDIALIDLLGKALSKTAAGIRVMLHDLATPEMLAGLQNGKLHAALVVQPSKQAARGITFETLRTYPIVVAVPSKHNFTRRRSVTLRDVVEEPIVGYSRQEFPDYHEMLRRIAGPLAKQLRFVEECDGVMSLIAAIESGKGVTLTAASLANTAGARLRYVTLTPAPPPAVVGVAYRKGKLDPIRQLFIHAARSAATGVGLELNKDRK